jgi:hypothetical protein
MERYSACPNDDCGAIPKGYMQLGSEWFPVMGCEQCGQRYCYNCADEETCPHCGSDEKEIVGAVFA